MGLFENMLSGNESLFLNEVVLDFDYIPKLFKYRENDQKYIAECIKPLFNNRDGRNLFVYGSQGIGKSACIKVVLRELQEKSDINCIYVNCWKFNTSFKVISEICSLIGYKWVHNKRTDELLDASSKILNKEGSVIILDEADKLEEQEIIYSLLEDLDKKCIFLITNNSEFLIKLDTRIKSRLRADMIEFKPYNKIETEGILRQRMEFAFVKDIFDEDGFSKIVDKTFNLEDMRIGLFLMKESGERAENDSSKKILLKHVDESLKNLDKFMLKDKLEVGDTKILEIIKENSGKSIGSLFEIYQKNNGDVGYKTFSRRIKDLEKAGLISTKEIVKNGKTRIVEYGVMKKLEEF